MVKSSLPEKIVLGCIYALLSLLAAIVVYPFLHVLAVSFSDRGEALRAGFHFYPRAFSLEPYRNLFAYPYVWIGYGNTVFRMAAGTLVSLLVTVFAAYPLSRPDFPIKRALTLLLLFTMIFDGGIVPHYLLLKELHLLNTRWAYVLPHAANAFHVLVMIAFFKSISADLTEAAKIDGARDLRILFRIVIPLSVPVLVTVGLWSLVFHINAFMDNLLYVTDKQKFVLQLIIREILIDNKLDDFSNMTASEPPAPESLKMSSVIVSVLPVVVLYPFMLRFFEKGTLVGSVKG